MSAPEPVGLPPELIDQLVHGDVDSLVRVVLDTIVRLTGLETSYLTFIDWAADTQEVGYSTAIDGLEIAEGLTVPWSETLCRRAMTGGVSVTSDADQTFGTDNAGHDLGIVSFVSVPLVAQDEVVYGTLCAASRRSVPIDDEAMELVRGLAKLLGRHVDQERSLRRAQQAEQRLRERMMLLAVSEHRLKTPLTVIGGIAALLSARWDDFSDEHRRELIETVSRNSSDLRSCVDVLLAQAREEMDELDVPTTALFVEPALRQLVTDHQRAAAGHRIDFACDPSVVVRIDPSELRQLLGHLIDNAVSYTPDGSHISVSVRADGGRATITVADDGPGLPEGLDPFAAFTRGPGSPELATGSGLGLYIVRSIAARAGGSVSAHNAPGGGAVFVTELPAA